MTRDTELTNAELAYKIASEHKLPFSQLWHQRFDEKGEIIIFTTPRLIRTLGLTGKSIGTIRHRIDSGRVHGSWRHGKARVIHLGPVAVQEIIEDEQ